ncbi:MAG: hypothetical protein EPN21_20170 [Methylococcaceae bacterium]|nr:MAG: hypothetical protein EPN21_20170 [Methylococcaceae bacterium]
MKGIADWALLPLDAARWVVLALSFGAQKHSRYGWQDVPEGEEVFTSKLLGHLAAWRAGERLDAESGLPHLAHMAANALFVVWHALCKKEAAK